MEDKKKIKIGMVISIFIIILLVIALSLIYYFGFVKNNQEILALKDKINVLSSKNVPTQSEKVEVKTYTAKSNNIESKDISVVDAVNYSDGYYNLFKIKLPKINGNTKTIAELNAKILNDVLPRTYSDVVGHATIEEAMDKGAFYDYKYIIKNNILIIYIYSSVPEGGSLMPTTGGGLEHCSYYYDIVNDKILTISEVANKLSLNLSGLKTLEGTDIKSYSKLEENGYIITINNNDLKLEFFL